MLIKKMKRGCGTLAKDMEHFLPCCLSISFCPTATAASAAQKMVNQREKNLVKLRTSSREGLSKTEYEKKQKMMMRLSACLCSSNTKAA